MTITCSQLQNDIDQLLNPSLFEDYCPNGLQISGKTDISKIAFAVSATQDSIAKAISWGADALIVHHGVFWKYVPARPITGPWGERVKMCIQNDINLFGYHLPLDAHMEVGNAATLAKLLGMTKLAPFGEYKRTYLGAKGKFPAPIKACDLKKKLEGILGRSVTHASPNDEQLISSLGIITGGANNEWSKAMTEDVESYLTGEISEYNWHDAKEAGIHYFAGGHHATEKFGIQALMHKLRVLHPSVDVQYFDSENPV